MGLWDDLYRINATEIQDGFEEEAGYQEPIRGHSVEYASEDGKAGTDTKTGKAASGGDPFARSNTEGARGFSNTPDSLTREQGEGLRGGSNGSLGSGDAEVSAQHAAMDAQRKTQTTPTEYNASMSAILTTRQTAPTAGNDIQSDPVSVEWGDMAGAMANYNTNWA